MAVGNNGFGQGNVTNWTGIVQVATGGFHTVGLKSDGLLQVLDTRTGQVSVANEKTPVAGPADLFLDDHRLLDDLFHDFLNWLFDYDGLFDDLRRGCLSATARRQNHRQKCQANQQQTLAHTIFLLQMSDNLLIRFAR